MERVNVDRVIVGRVNGYPCCVLHDLHLLCDWPSM